MDSSVVKWSFTLTNNRPGLYSKQQIAVIEYHAQLLSTPETADHVGMLMITPSLNHLSICTNLKDLITELPAGQVGSIEMMILVPFPIGVIR
jgi:hypothetical protein